MNSQPRPGPYLAPFHLNSLQSPTNLKSKLYLLGISLSLLQAAPALHAQENSSTNVSANFSVNVSTPTSSVTNAEPRRAAKPPERQELLLLPKVKARLEITEAQQSEFRSIEQDFAVTCRQFKAANQPRIDSALEADRQGRNAKDDAQIRAARLQLQQVWSGLQPYRTAATARLKTLLTPAQLRIVEDPANQWTDLEAIN
jgi:hypothetical protein